MSYYITRSTRPSPFSACNIEKWVKGWQRGYLYSSSSREFQRVHGAYIGATRSARTRLYCTIVTSGRRFQSRYVSIIYGCIQLTSLWLFCHTPYSVGIPFLYIICIFGYNQILDYTLQNLVYLLTASTDLDVLAGSASRNWQNH